MALMPPMYKNRRPMSSARWPAAVGRVLLSPVLGGEGADGARITSSAKTASTGTCKRPERVLGVQPLIVLDMVFAAAIDGAWIVAVTMSEPLVMVSVISSALTP